jgi:pSer/pThr/pTyr-binding forkhead associated (FHA) protein
LGNGVNKGAFLKGIQGEKIEEVRIFKNSFIIGRSKPQVDFALQSKFVGKVHSEIINREDNYFIKDINSHNGTFVNNLRIDSNKEYEIRDGDKLVFADSEYAFFNEKIDVSNHFVSLN